MSKRIVILTDAADRHFYFCNRLVEETGAVVGIVTGGKEINRGRFEELHRTVSRHPSQALKQLYYQKRYTAYGNALKREKREAEDRYFGGQEAAFRTAHGDLVIGHVSSQHRSINDERIVDIIRNARPDIIAVMGTCMLGRKVLDSAPCVLNMHTGLSPYYRGGRTNFWPFVDNAPGFFGVTVHKMSPGIDSGDIIHSQRVLVEPDDNYATINCRSIAAGTALMIDALKRFEAGTCKSMPQWTSGKVFFDRDWTFKAAKTYFANRETLVRQQIAGEKRGEFSHIRTVRNGRMVDG